MNKTLSEYHLSFIFNFLYQTDKPNSNTLLKEPNHPSVVDFVDLMIEKYPEKKYQLENYKSKREGRNRSTYLNQLKTDFTKAFKNIIHIEEDFNLWIEQLSVSNNSDKIDDILYRFFEKINTELPIEFICKKENALGLYSEHIKRHPKKLDKEIVYYFGEQNVSYNSVVSERKLFTLLSKCPKDEKTYHYIEKLYENANSSLKQNILSLLKSYDVDFLLNTSIPELKSFNVISEEESIEYKYVFKLDLLVVANSLNIKNEQAVELASKFGSYMLSKVLKGYSAEYIKDNKIIYNHYEEKNNYEAKIVMKTSNGIVFDEIKEKFKVYKDNMELFVTSLGHPDIGVGLDNFNAYIELQSKTYNNKNKEVKIKL